MSLTPNHLDFETYSEVDLIRVGAWAYSVHPSTEVLMMAYAVGEKAPKLWLPGMPAPAFGPGDQLIAWNDFFEYCIMKNVLGWPVPEPSHWLDAAAEAAALALPRSLAGCCAALGLPVDLAKDKAGKALITLFCKPRKSTKKGVTTLVRTYPADRPKEFELFKKYCIQDVIAEREVRKRLRPLSKEARITWEMDRKINIRGVGFDVQSIHDVQAMRKEAAKSVLDTVSEVTDGKLTNINSDKQLAEYLQAFCDIELDNAQAEYLKGKLEKLITVCETELDPETRAELSVPITILQSRLKIAKSSLAKYDKILAIIDGDRAYGLLRYHGASTGRWSGNLFQPQNLPRPSIKDTDSAISLFKHRDHRMLDLAYGDSLEAMSSCIRGMVVPKPGHRFIVSDFKQIESRVLAWLAGYDKKLDVFRSGQDVYKLNAVTALHKKYEAVTGADRDVGKVMELAFGFQGSIGAWKHFEGMYGISRPDDEIKALVKNWRLGNPKITALWRDTESAAIQAIANPGAAVRVGKCIYKCVGKGLGKFLLCKLPSGRQIAYHRPALVEGPYDKPQIQFWGVNSTTKKYCSQTTYGGKLVQNNTQAAACDIMSHKLPQLEAAGYPIILLVHDEVISEVPENQGSLTEFNEIMRETPEWAAGLPIDAAGYESKRYRK